MQAAGWAAELGGQIAAVAGGCWGAGAMKSKRSLARSNNHQANTPNRFSSLYETTDSSWDEFRERLEAGGQQLEQAGAAGLKGVRDSFR